MSRAAVESPTLVTQKSTQQGPKHLIWLDVPQQWATLESQRSHSTQIHLWFCDSSWGTKEQKKKRKNCSSFMSVYKISNLEISYCPVAKINYPLMLKHHIELLFYIILFCITLLHFLNFSVYGYSQSNFISF